MESMGFDETRDVKPELRLEGPQVALAGLASPRVRQKVILHIEAEVRTVHTVNPQDSETAEYQKPYVVLSCERITTELPEPDPMDAIRRMFPSVSNTVVHPV